MEQNQDLKAMLNQMDAPAFMVQNGTVCAVNAAAAQYGITVSENIQNFVLIGKEEYDHFTEGNLYLTLCLNGVKFDCSVIKLQNGDLFTLEEAPVQAELQALSLAAKQLSFPLSELSILFDRSSEIESSKKEKINQTLFRLHRIINNMADTVQIQNNLQHLKTIELCSAVEEILEKAKTLLSCAETNVIYDLPNKAIYTLASVDLLERAIYNLLSNAAKYTAGDIEITLSQVDRKVYLTVKNRLKGISGELYGRIFSRYKRKPGLEDPSCGLGLGMTFVHAAAKAHRGTVLVESPAENEIKITMSLSIQQQKSTDVRSTIMKPDIYGGRDRALVELSDVLPSHLYNSDKF